jgi:hypothetical protein
MITFHAPYSDTLITATRPLERRTRRSTSLFGKTFSAFLLFMSTSRTNSEVQHSTTATRLSRPTEYSTSTRTATSSSSRATTRNPRATATPSALTGRPVKTEQANDSSRTERFGITPCSRGAPTGSTQRYLPEGRLATRGRKTTNCSSQRERQAVILPSCASVESFTAVGWISPTKSGPT